MAFYKNGLGIEILRYLNKCGRLPRKNLAVPFSAYSYRYYARVVQQLIAKEYIAVERYGGVYCVNITEAGKTQLLETFRDDQEESKTIKKEKSTAKTTKEKRRAKLVADVEGLCLANGIIVDPVEKLSLVELMGTQTKENHEKFAKQIKDGIYYSIRELRSAYMEVMGKSEIANWTRLVGILFLKGHLSFLYSVDKKLIQWMSTNEKRSVEFILAFLKRSETISEFISFEEYPSCIVCGSGMSMIPKLVTGRKWGRTDGKENTERYRAKFAATHINAHNLNKVFCAAYYVTCNKYGIDHFRLAAMLSQNIRDTICNDWFSHINTATFLRTLRYHQGVTTNGRHERVAYIPCVDLIELEFLANQGTPCHIIAPKGTQEAISRVMGPLIISFRSLEGELLPFRKYNKDGSPVDPSSMNIQGNKKEIKTERTEKGDMLT